MPDVLLDVLSSANCVALLTLPSPFLFLTPLVLSEVCEEDDTTPTSSLVEVSLGVRVLPLVDELTEPFLLEP